MGLSLKPSLVEWKQQELDDVLLRGWCLETFLGGMETHPQVVDQNDLLGP